VAAVYFTLSGAIGTLLPFLAIYYSRLGLSGAQISVLVSVQPLLVLLSQPLFGPLADRSGHRGRLLARLTLPTAIFGALMGLGSSFWTLLPLVAVWAFFSGTLWPIADSIALGEAAERGLAYSQLRLWGSIGYLITTSVVGRVYAVVDLRWSFLVYGVMMMGSWLVMRRLPADGVSERTPEWSEIRRVVTNPELVVFVLIAGVLQLAQAAHSTFFSIRLQTVGGSNAVVGVAWALAALSEVPVWWVLGRIIRRVGGLPLLAFAGLAYAVRFWLYSLVTAPWGLASLQLLQAFSFAIFVPTAIVMTGELVPPALRTSGQALLALVTLGLATVAGNLGAGQIVDRIGTAGLYQVLTGVALMAGVGFLVLHLLRGRTQRMRGQTIHG